MIPIVQNVTNPITGVFGDGNVQWFTTSGTWVVPPGAAACRVRLWGAGGSSASSSASSGGGFAIRIIDDLSGYSSIIVTVGVSASGTSGGVGGTSSFGSFCSATGGSISSGGTGVGGDTNNTGGRGYAQGGGGVASIFGNGNTPQRTEPASGGAGGGSDTNSTANSSGPFSYGGFGRGTTTDTVTQPTIDPYIFSNSIDFIGTGAGGAYNQSGANGGGGGNNGRGGWPGGGAGSTSSGANGLVIVEW